MSRGEVRKRGEVRIVCAAHSLYSLLSLASLPLPAEPAPCPRSLRDMKSFPRWGAVRVLGVGGSPHVHFGHDVWYRSTPYITWSILVMMKLGSAHFCENRRLGKW